MRCFDRGVEGPHINVDSCRGCGSNYHKTACCPDRPCPCCSNHHRRGILDCPVYKARQQRKAAAAATRAAKKAMRQQVHAANMAVFLSLRPFGVEIKNWSMFTDGNWASEAASICPRFNKPEPRNGFWCMKFK